MIKTVVSMSRRTDPHWHHDKLIPVLERRYPPEKVHTLVVWTKFPETLVSRPYRDVLSRYDQVYCHITITGLGGTELEPNVPRPQEALGALAALAEFVGSPARVRVRPDPLVVLCRQGKILTNITAAETIIRQAARLGIAVFSTSFMETYPKVTARLKKHGFEIVPLSQQDRRRVIRGLAQSAAGESAALHTCAVPGFPPSKCIDGELLARLHPAKLPCRADKAAGQRPLCGCTHSVDIGWYSMTCRSGCLYCYARPG